ncbi:NUDIX domain-containing protein [Frankia sp. EI5c]|uniref:NUDIX domain-containing protein n=1 Tax=Frankia sp. EI5c TaxID=683316 RepID=UPI0018FE3466|nr:NUDIX domain-containing protein [Frankia sp. EI5c]
MTDTVLLTTSDAPAGRRRTAGGGGGGGSGGCATPPAGAWRLPGGALRLGEPARETALRLAAEAVGSEITEPQLSLVHTAHHRLGGEERVSLYFALHRDAALSGARPGRPGPETTWQPLAGLPAGLEPLDRAVLASWRRAEPYSEPGWHPVRPPSPSSLSPLETLRSH